MIDYDSESVNIIHTPEQLIEKIESFGFALFVGSDGVVHGRAVEPGTKVPWEMRPLLAEMRAMNEQIAAIVKARDEGKDIIVLSGLTPAEAMDWAKKVQAGEYRLVPGTQVAYRKSEGLTYMQLERIKK